MYVHVCVCVYVCVYVCICMYAYMCVYVCMYVCMCVCTYVCLRVCTYVCMYVCVCKCVCMYVLFVYVCSTYIYLHAYITVVYKYEILLETDTFVFQNTSVQKTPFSYIQTANYLIINPNYRAAGDS
jgi:hypothetical protein